MAVFLAERMGIDETAIVVPAKGASLSTRHSARPDANFSAFQSTTATGEE